MVRVFVNAFEMAASAQNIVAGCLKPNGKIRADDDTTPLKDCKSKQTEIMLVGADNVRMDEEEDGNTAVGKDALTFRYREAADGNSRFEYGLIAEEVVEVYPELVVHSKSGEIQTVQYHKLSTMLLNELQKQHRKIQKQEQRMSKLEEIIALLASHPRTLEMGRDALEK